MLFFICPFSSPNPKTIAALERSLKCSASPPRTKQENANGASAGAVVTSAAVFSVAFRCCCHAPGQQMEYNPVKFNQEFKLLTWRSSCYMKSASRPRLGVKAENGLKQLNRFQFPILWRIFRALMSLNGYRLPPRLTSSTFFFSPCIFVFPVHPFWPPQKTRIKLWMTKNKYKIRGLMLQPGL